MSPVFDYLLGIGALAASLGLIAVYDLDGHGKRAIDWLLGSAAPRRPRQWGVK